jgi:hypothetical protein
MIAAGRRGEVVEYFIEKVVGLPPEVVAQARKSPFWHEQEALAHTLVYDTILLGDGSLPVERAAAVKASTLVLEGGESFPFMRGTARALADFIQYAQWCVLEGQTHEVAQRPSPPCWRSSSSAEAGAGRAAMTERIEMEASETQARCTG